MLDKLGTFLIAVFALAVYAYFAHEYMIGHVAQNADTAAVIGGILNTTGVWAGLGVGYFVGSSAGSAAKDKTISNMSPGTGNGTTTPSPSEAAKV